MKSEIPWGVPMDSTCPPLSEPMLFALCTAGGILTQEEQIGGGMDEEFHKGLAHQLARPAIRGAHVYEAVEREQDGHLADAEDFVHNALAPESGEPVIPNGGQ